MEIKLKANTANEKIILAYLKDNASDALAERINTGDKTLKQCWNYIVTEAKKKAVNGCACVEDSTVFGWAIHFFEEESIRGEEYGKASNVVSSTAKVVTPKKTVPAASKPPKKEKTVAPKPQEQFSFEDFFGEVGNGSCED